ncbi:hypothetical protein BJV74DRAFT_781778, partial [Russula compacta]
ALIDSGATRNFVHTKFAEHHKLPLIIAVIKRVDYPEIQKKKSSIEFLIYISWNTDCILMSYI